MLVHLLLDEHVRLSLSLSKWPTLFLQLFSRNTVV